MDDSARILPISEDRMILEDVQERFDEKVSKIDELAQRLEENHHESDLLDLIKQEIHALFLLSTSTNIPPIVEPLEVIDNVFAHITESTDSLPWLLQASVALLERLQIMIGDAATTGGVDFEHVQFVQNAITPLAHLHEPEKIFEAAKVVVNMLTGGFENDSEEDLSVDLFDDEPYIEGKVEFPRPDLDRESFGLLRILSETMDNRHRFWKGRTDFIVSLALGMNALADNRVDIDQLEAAIYLHDFPMSRLSDEILYGKKLSQEDIFQIKQHPVQAYELALTLTELDECAKIVFQHHERPDGKGYPEGITGSAICDGAKIIAICDAFHSMTHTSSYRPNRRSILRAMVEINANKHTQFDTFWVQKFNVAIRVQRLGGFI